MNCKRCDSAQVRKMADSPVGKVWEVYICDKCNFSWRSTENIEVWPQFKLDDQKIATMQQIPPVPPLKK